MNKMTLLFNLNNTNVDYLNKLLSIMRLHKAIKNNKTMKKNIELFRFKKSDRCFVAGLGPSLKGVDFEKLDGDLIVTNEFHRFAAGKNIKPTFYCLSDQAYFTGSDSAVFQDIYSVYQDACFLLNGNYKKEIEQIISYHGVKNCYYAYMWNGAYNHKIIPKLEKVVPMVMNIVHLAEYLAIYLKYKEIYLIGCDFSSFASPVQNHCYEDESEDRLWDLDFELYCYSIAAHQHYELSLYAKENNICIRNATKGSLLDTYPFDQEMIDRIYH